jgi:long-chain fatty acid transport protein
MFNASDATRVGLAYRSPVAYTLKGNATFSGGGGTLDSGAQADLKVPESVALSAFSSVSPQWELMGAAIWTRWDRLQSLTVIRTSASALGPEGSTITTFQFKWRNTVLLAAGANYRPSEEWKIRVGIAYDPAVSNDETRTARLPDQSRVALSLGGRYTAGKNDSFDLAYSHDFIRNASINNVTAAGTLTGTFKSSADILSAQYNRRF